MRNPLTQQRLIDLEKRVGKQVRDRPFSKRPGQFLPSPTIHLAKTTGEGVEYPGAGKVYPIVFLDGNKFLEEEGAIVEFTDLSATFQRWAATIDDSSYSVDENVVVFHQNNRWWIISGGGSEVEIAVTLDVLPPATIGSCYITPGEGPIQLVEYACGCYSKKSTSTVENPACWDFPEDWVIAVKKHPNCVDKWILIADIGPFCGEPPIGCANAEVESFPPLVPYDCPGVCPPFCCDEEAWSLGCMRTELGRGGEMFPLAGPGPGSCEPSNPSYLFVCGWKVIPPWVCQYEDTRFSPAIPLEQRITWGLCLLHCPAGDQGCDEQDDWFTWQSFYEIETENLITHETGFVTGTLLDAGDDTLVVNPSPSYFANKWDGGSVTFHAERVVLNPSNPCCIDFDVTFRFSLP